jgi:Flp pilus assembly protein TadG
MKPIPKRHRSSKGQALIEFALKSDRRKGSTLIEFAFVLLTLLAVIFGSIEMDRMFLAYNALTDSARAGVRYAVVHGKYADGTDCSAGTITNIKNVVTTFVGMGMLDASRATVTVTCQDGTGHIGSPVYVDVSYVYDPLTSFFPLSVTLRGTAKGTFTF